MTDNRIKNHPILAISEEEIIEFTFNGKKLTAKKNEVITSALIAHGVNTFGHHPKDESPQGIFCANGQCSQCMVIANGKAVKGCMTKVEPNMIVESCDGLPSLPEEQKAFDIPSSVKETKTQVLILGAGPSGLSAARELGERGIQVILVDDKDRMGGKLVLQTHKFFGSQSDCYAGTRGITIAEILAEDVKKHSNIDVWLNSTAIAVFSDKKVGILKNEKDYVLVRPQKLLVATGAREKNLIFPGNTLPGVYGAGAFQTLVNRDLVKPCKKLFIVGGGNVGLIAGYHALQAGINVVGLVEALPKCGGYKVHEDKLRRSGVPIYTRHTILSANGSESVESVTIAQLDDNWKPIKGTERTFDVDTILIAVGLDPVDEFYHKAKRYEMEVWSAGDAQEIAEASAAMFSGKIEAIDIAKSIGIEIDAGACEGLKNLLNILKKPGGDVIERNDMLATPEREEGVFPVFHCTQQIPCNPCTSVCPIDQIETVDGEIVNLPYFRDEQECKACGQCVAVCPGLAVTLVDYRKDSDMPSVTLPFEMEVTELQKGHRITILDNENNEIGEYEVIKVRKLKKYPGTQLVTIRINKKYAKTAAGILVQKDYELTAPVEKLIESPMPDSAIVCRCERITASEIREWIRKGVHDVNQIKAITRAGMGACGGKTCSNLILRLFREENIPLKEVTPGTERPVFVEVPFGIFAGINDKEE
jgi:sarcosine oxidase subunit alpha